MEVLRLFHASRRLLERWRVDTANRFVARAGLVPVLKARSRQAMRPAALHRTIHKNPWGRASGRIAHSTPGDCPPMSIRLLVLSVLATATLAGSAIAAEPAPSAESALRFRFAGPHR